MRGFVEDQCALLTGQTFKQVGPRLGARRQITFKDEAIGCHSRDTESCDQGRRSRNWHHRYTGGSASCDQSVTGICNTWRSGVTDQGNSFTGPETLEDFTVTLPFIMVVVRQQRFPDPKPIEELAAVTGVLCSHQIDLTEDFNRPVGDVLQVADRCCHDIERARTVLTLSFLHSGQEPFFFFLAAICSSSASHNAALASLGMRQSPRGDRETVTTLGPSGRQDLLNCCEKKRR